MSNDNEYLLLADLIRKGLEPGTEIVARGADDDKVCRRAHLWNGYEVLTVNGACVNFNPFLWAWRIVSVPPKRIELERTVSDGRLFFALGSVFKDGDKVKVTIEGVNE